MWFSQFHGFFPVGPADISGAGIFMKNKRNVDQLLTSSYQANQFNKFCHAKTLSWTINLNGFRKSN
jgi:hypothetical protein